MGDGDRDQGTRRVDITACPGRHGPGVTDLVLPAVDLGLFHLGGTKVLGIMVTMDGRQGVEAVRLIDPRVAVPIHYDDYDVFTSPLSEFTDAARDAGLGDRVTVLRRGVTYPLA